MPVLIKAESKVIRKSIRSSGLLYEGYETRKQLAKKIFNGTTLLLNVSETAAVFALRSSSMGKNRDHGLGVVEQMRRRSC